MRPYFLYLTEVTGIRIPQHLCCLAYGIVLAPEQLSGLQVAYFTGASGNQNADSKIPEEAHNLDWMGYGTKLGQIFNDKLAENYVEMLKTLQ